MTDDFTTYEEFEIAKPVVSQSSSLIEPDGSINSETYGSIILHKFIELCKQYHYHGSWPTEFNSVCEELAELIRIGTVSMKDIPPDNALTAGYILRCRGDITSASRFMAYAFMTSEEARNTDIFNDYRNQANSNWGNTVNLLELVTKRDNEEKVEIQEKVEYFLSVLSNIILSKDISAPTPETETQPTPETMNVQVISAEWCKRCHVIKPEVAKVCALTQIPYNVLDFDELDEADKLTVKSLPTIRILRGGVVDSTYTASEFEAWKSVLMAAASGTKDEDF